MDKHLTLQAQDPGRVADAGRVRSQWVIHRYADEEAYRRGQFYARSIVQNNLLLNAGITVALNLLGGIAATAWDNANAYLGVGDSNTEAAAGQTGLQAAVNTAYAGMEDGYPSVTDQTITWRAVFGADAANFDWREFSVGNADAGAGDNLNRKVENQGTKASGQVWTLDLQITLS